MKLEEGKYYKTRDGRKVGPMESWSSYQDKHPFESDGLLWMADGTGYEGNHPGQDIVSLWKDEATEPKLSGETIDLIAIDSLKWHMADGDMEPLQLEAFRIVLRYYGVSV